MIMENFDYDRFNAYMSVALASFVSIAIATMLVIHLLTSVVGVTAFLMEAIMVAGSVYMAYIAYSEFMALKK